MPPRHNAADSRRKGTEATSDEATPSAKAVRATLRAKNAKWLPGGKKTKQMLLIGGILVGLYLLIFLLFPEMLRVRTPTKAPTPPGKGPTKNSKAPTPPVKKAPVPPVPPSYMDTVHAKVSLETVSGVEAFEYVRSPHTWVYWRADTSSVAGAVEHPSEAGRAFLERSLIEGAERDITWVTTHAGKDSFSKYRVSFSGTVDGMQLGSPERKLKTSFVVTTNSTNSSAVSQSLSFGYQGFTDAEREAMKKLYRGQMEQSLQRLQQRLLLTRGA